MTVKSILILFAAIVSALLLTSLILAVFHIVVLTTVALAKFGLFVLLVLGVYLLIHRLTKKA